MTAYVFLAEGFEEVEALTPVDILRRGGVTVKTVGIGGRTVTGSHGIPVVCDIAEEDVIPDEIDMMVLPGGMPGTIHLGESLTIQEGLAYAAQEDLWVAAICAAPTILAQLHITDGRGNLYRCEIVDDNPKRCRVRVRDTNSEFGKLPYRLTMAVAPTKNNDRFEWFLEKATEIGVAEIIPLATEHSERRTLKPERENKVITAAVKQSLKAYHPRLHEMTPLRQVIKQPFDGQKFIAHCDAPRSALGKAFLPHILHKGGDVLVLIGPEGDFSPEEIDLAVRGGFREITLGSQRLRTETAAVMATALVAAANESEIGTDDRQPSSKPVQ